MGTLADGQAAHNESVMCSQTDTQVTQKESVQRTNTQRGYKGYKD